MRFLVTVTLLSICLTATGQTFQLKKESWPFTKNAKRQKALASYPLTYYPGTYIDTESRYTDSTGIAIVIQNSLPKGGKRYTDSAGKEFRYVIFWTRIINETTAPLELTINFPADSFATDPLPDYIKFFLPPGIMTLDKEGLISYGVTGLESFLDSALHTSTTLQKTINPKEAYSFYTGMLSYRAAFQPGLTRHVTLSQGVGGSVRAGFVLKGHDLFYTNNIVEQPDLVRWGHIILKK